jgi:hypothetical protein|tara:strand:+ start:1237 stop:1830 length:594 start_codon:yes stop_codon:yes gene_type:complete
MFEPIPSEENNSNSTFSLIETPDETTNITDLYQKEELDRIIFNNNSSKIPERYKKPKDTTQQRTELENFKNKIGTRKCYTCFPKRLAKDHTITIDYENKVKFHFDMCNRPLIIATPFSHINTLSGFEEPEHLSRFFTAIKLFCDFWNIKDYQIQINHGDWQNHSHLHVKIRANEDFLHKLRQDHFKLLKLKKERGEQ